MTKVLILHTLPPDVLEDARNPWEFDLSAGARSIAEVLPGSVVTAVRGYPQELLDLLSKHRPDVVFNACEAPLGNPGLEAHVAALLEWVGIPFTGSGSEALALCRRKDHAKAVLSAAGVAVPRRGGYPCIVKPATGDGSAGIHANSICTSERELAAILRQIDVPVVVEEFLEGREFAISLWGNRDPEWASVGETRFTGGLRLNTYAAKWNTESEDFANSPMVYDKSLELSLRQAILKAASQAWHAVGVRGYARVDVRLNSAGRPYVLEVNPNPDLSPGAGIHRAAMEIGISWDEFVRKQIEWALSFARS